MPTVLVPLDETAFAESILPGLSRMLAGNVAADLIDRLSLPIIVIPSLVETAQKPEPGAANEPAPASTPEVTPA